MDKPSLRKSLRALGRALPESERLERSRSVVAQLKGLLEDIRPQRLALYMAMPDEPDLRELLDDLAERCEVCLPRVRSAEDIDFARYQGGETLVEAGGFGILEPRAELEPISPSSLDVIVVPAMAYDKAGYRLGRGRGYYDRYLQRTRAYTIGVTLDIDPEASWAIDDWDVPMDVVLRPR